MSVAVEVLMTACMFAYDFVCRRVYNLQLCTACCLVVKWAELVECNLTYQTWTCWSQEKQLEKWKVMYNQILYNTKRVQQPGKPEIVAGYKWYKCQAATK